MPPKCQPTTIFTIFTWLRYVRVYNAIANPYVVCLSSAPYSGGGSFRQYFFTAVYLSHLLTSQQKFTEIVPGESLRRGR